MWALQSLQDLHVYVACGVWVHFQAPVFIGGTFMHLLISAERVLDTRKCMPAAHVSA